MGTMQGGESIMYNGKKKLNRKGQPAISPEEVLVVSVHKCYCSVSLPFIFDEAIETILFAGTGQGNYGDSCRAHARSEGGA